MRHLEVGIVIGLIWAGILIIAAGVMAVLNLFFGAGVAVAIVTTTVILIAGASFIDWYTERRKG